MKENNQYDNKHTSSSSSSSSTVSKLSLAPVESRDLPTMMSNSTIGLKTTNPHAHPVQFARAALLHIQFFCFTHAPSRRSRAQPSIALFHALRDCRFYPKFPSFFLRNFLPTNNPLNCFFHLFNLFGREPTVKHGATWVTAHSPPFSANRLLHYSLIFRTLQMSTLSMLMLDGPFWTPQKKSNQAEASKRSDQSETCKCHIW